MHLSIPLVVLSVLLPATYGAPTSNVVKISKCPTGHAEGGIYMVALKKGLKPATSTVKTLIPQGIVVTPFKKIPGFHGKLDEDTVKKLSTHPDVRVISQNCRRKHQRMAVQADAPWGISRLTSTTKLTGAATLLTHPYTYTANAGSCADIYVVDGGVNIHHVDFGGRARHGKSFGTYTAGKETEDADGHGTHCAGIAAGTRYGVAKGAHVIAVKVGDETGVDDLNIVDGLEWIQEQVEHSGRPSVVSYSIGTPSVDDMIDLAADIIITQGAHFVAAAGNQGVDVQNTSPAHLSEVITVGATDINDHKASFSNFGDLVDVFAPGKEITSAWIGSNTANKVQSGTSMATPHVAGIVAIHMCQNPTQVHTPAQMQQLIITNSLKDKLTDIGAGSHNRLAHIPGAAGSTTPPPTTGGKTPPPPPSPGHKTPPIKP